MCHLTVTLNFAETFNQHCLTSPRELKFLCELIAEHVCV